MSTAVAYAPNRYHHVQMNTASLNYAPTKGCACSSLKGVPLHCIIFRTATDPVCGSGHCHIIPYWADTLGKEELVACQASKRGGTLFCRREGNRIFMAGKAALYSVDELFIDEV